MCIYSKMFNIAFLTVGIFTCSASEPKQILMLFFSPECFPRKFLSVCYKLNATCCHFRTSYTVFFNSQKHNYRGGQKIQLHSLLTALSCALQVNMVYISNDLGQAVYLLSFSCLICIQASLLDLQCCWQCK